MLVVSLRDVNHRLLSYLLWSGRNATRRQVSSVFRVAREGKKKHYPLESSIPIWSNEA